jgi:CheY-like chemotaxis protein
MQGKKGSRRMAMVLVVDDDQDIRDALVEILADEGHVAVGKANGAEALDWLRQGHVPDVVLLDLMMPVMNGWDFAAAVQREPRWARLPLVVLSGGGDLSTQAEALKATAFLVKPIRLDTLLSTIDDLAA